MSRPAEAAKGILVLAAVAAVYAAAGKLGLQLAFFNASVSPVWPGSGIALVAFLVLGGRAWPAIFIGALVVNAHTLGAAATTLGIALGNTLEAALGAYLVVRHVGGRDAFGRTTRVVKFALLAAGISPIVGATLGVTSLVLGGFALWGDYGFIWLTWWLGAATGDLVLAPALLLWIRNPKVRWNPRKAREGVGLLLAVTLAGVLVFGEVSQVATDNHPLGFLCLLPLLWAAFRFGPREAATAVLLFSALAIWGTLAGVGPFVHRSPNRSLLLLQGFTAVAALMSLITAAAVSERRYVEAQLRGLSVTDPLTGLPNYRRLVSVLEDEIERSARTGRSFALLFLDLDDLKIINDRLGHVVGSRALCRLAEVLRRTCRAVDTAARYGGDEFAVVLPETGELEAREVGHRVVDRLKLDGEHPTLSVSVGVAVHPRDGATAEALIGSADRLLYEMKRRPASLP